MTPPLCVALVLGLTTVLACPARAEDPETRAGAPTTPAPFAGAPLSVADLRAANATGPTGTVDWRRPGWRELAVVLWDEALPPSSQTPAPRPRRSTEIRANGRLMLTTVTSPR